jgi:uncharacterized membrane protein YbaN (DUF454 family)
MSNAAPHPSHSRTPLQRRAYAVLGAVLTVVGVAGIILPYVPGVVFLILAATCFTRSSPKLEARLLNHPRLGPPVVAWRSTGAIPPRAKLLACLGMSGSYVLLLVVGAPPVAVACAALGMGAAAAFVITRPDG